MSTISVDIPVLQPVDEQRISTSVAAAPAIAKSERNATLDAARVIAALGLVWIHTTQSSLSRLHVLGRFFLSFIRSVLRRGSAMAHMPASASGGCTYPLRHGV